MKRNPLRAGDGTGRAAGPVILFDGHCSLCVRSTRFVLERDRREVFRFGVLDSPGTRQLLDACRADPVELEDVRRGVTVALVSDSRLYVRSEAALRIAAGLPWPWKALSLLRLVPRALRDRAYATVARRRHRVASRLGACPLPTEDRARFL